jgi:nitrite reductase (cytochrome c-552)
MWAGYAFSLDYRESRGHAYTLHDQDHTERVLQRPQPGACLHCHASIMPAYRYMGERRRDGGLPPRERHAVERGAHVTDALGVPLVQHPVTCVDCHSPDNMALRVTRPAFNVGIRDYMASQGGRLRREPRRDAAGDAHAGLRAVPRRVLLRAPGQARHLPVGNGCGSEQIEAYYDSIGFSDWTHGMTGGGMLKAQHPEFELWSQGVHAQAGVSCADCHMPYRREGAMKVSDHHVRSPMLNIQRACQTCHNVPEQELRDRVHTIQDRTHALIQRAAPRSPT